MIQNQDLPKILLNHNYQYIPHLWTRKQKNALQNTTELSFSGIPGPKEIPAVIFIKAVKFVPISNNSIFVQVLCYEMPTDTRLPDFTY